MLRNLDSAKCSSISNAPRFIKPFVEVAWLELELNDSRSFDSNNESFDLDLAELAALLEDALSSSTSAKGFPLGLSIRSLKLPGEGAWAEAGAPISKKRIRNETSVEWRIAP